MHKAVLLMCGMAQRRPDLSPSLHKLHLFHVSRSAESNCKACSSTTQLQLDAALLEACYQATSTLPAEHA